MAQIIDIDPDTRWWRRQLEQQPADGDDGFWPEVSTRYSLENPAPESLQNAQGRVLFEVAITLAIVGFLAAVAAFLAPALS